MKSLHPIEITFQIRSPPNEKGAELFSMIVHTVNATEQSLILVFVLYV